MIQVASEIQGTSSSAGRAIIARADGWGSSVIVAEGKHYCVCDASCGGSPNAIARAHAFEDDGTQA